MMRSSSTTSRDIDWQLVEPTLLYLLKDEHKFRPRADYLTTVQSEGGIKAWMRNHLIEWVSEVCGGVVVVCAQCGVRVLIARRLDCVHVLAVGSLCVYARSRWVYVFATLSLSPPPPPPPPLLPSLPLICSLPVYCSVPCVHVQCRTGIT